jgi:Mg/Co/Ni transporter MgtE
VADETDVPNRSPGDGLVAALRVPRNAAVGAAVGATLAAVLYLVRVFELLGPFGGTRRFPVLGPERWFLLLAVVLATTTALLVTALLTLVVAVRLARRGAPGVDGEGER